jgi:hypothetical protein
MTWRIRSAANGRSSRRRASGKSASTRMKPMVGSRLGGGPPWLMRPTKKPAMATLIPTEMTRPRMSHLLERIINLLVVV